MNVSCVRCQKVLTVEVLVDGDAIDGEEVTVGVADHEGMVMFVCNDCCTNREVWQRACQSAAALLDACDAAIASYEMVFERIPASREDADLKAAYAQAQEQAAEARETLVRLMRHDPDDE